MVLAFGGICCLCRDEFPQELFEFHHLNPVEKKFGLGAIRSNCMSWDKIVKELRKCVMMCANCHRLIEYGYAELPATARRFDESYANYKRKVKPRTKINKCICGNDKQANRKYCSQGCYHSHTRRVNWPTKDELKLLLRSNSLNKIGKMYGVSHSAVNKWKKFYRL
jgi:hypothetical protein